MLSLHQQLKLGLKLTPQQVQYLKLLQLPSLSLEQRVKLELEQNPMLEVAEDLEPVQEEESPERFVLVYCDLVRDLSDNPFPGAG